MAEDVPISFYPTGGLYLKQIALIFIEVRLPEIRNPGVTVSNWEVMEKIKAQSQPEEYENLRVILSTRELIRFEGEFKSKRALRKCILLLNGKSLKLKGFSDPLKMKAHESDPACPKKQDWEDYFVDKGVECFDEGRPGERPDTVHVQGLPIRWFVSTTSGDKPCPHMVTQAFQKFGKVRQVAFTESMQGAAHKTFSSFGPGAEHLNFEAYIQYDRYQGFCTAMGSLSGVKLMRLQAGGQAVVKLKVDYDRTGFLSERGIRKRMHLEEKRRREREEEERQKQEEERQKEIKRLEELKAKEQELEEKRKKKLEEKRERKKQQTLLAAHLRSIALQRRQEAQRLMGALLARIVEDKYQEELKEKEMLLKMEEEKLRKEQLKEEREKRNKLIQNVQELELRKQALQKELTARKKSKIKT